LVNRSVDSIVAVPGRVTSRLLFPLLRTWHNAAFGEFSVDQRSLLQATTVMLTESQITKYQQDGYVTPDFRLPEDILEDIRLAHRRLVERHPEFSDYCSALLAYDTWYLTIARIPEILDMVAQVIGDDIALWNSSFFAKPARVGTKTPWHQDGEYWPIAPLATCTVWIAIDASTPENGCLRVIPGSHREQRLAQHSKNDAVGLALNLELNKAEFSEEDAEDIVLEPGQVSLHDVYLYHGSEANVSDRPRRGMTLRYMPTTSVYEHEQPTRFVREGRLVLSQRTVFLMRGIDQSGQNDFRVRY
jgi:ectoine hydroxylase-related dioxygenase (phytanoyl-CoA dioxygenase family)